MTSDGLPRVHTAPGCVCVCVCARANVRACLKRLLVAHQQLIRHRNPIIFLNTYTFSFKVNSFLRKAVHFVRKSRIPNFVSGEPQSCAAPALPNFLFLRFERGANCHFMIEQGLIGTRVCKTEMLGEHLGREIGSLEVPGVA